MAGNSALMSQLVDKAYEVIENGFGRGEELEADEKGIVLANTVGYAPQGLNGFLTMLMERNKVGRDRNGLFASHPETKERVDRLTKQIASQKLASTATVAARYTTNITYKPVAAAEIAGVEAGLAGAAGGSAKPAEAPKKKGLGGLGGMLQPGRRREEVGAGHRFGRGPRRRQRGQERQGRQQPGAGRGHHRRRRAHRVQEGRRTEVRPISG